VALDALRSGDAQVAQQAVIRHYIRLEDQDATRIELMQQVIETIARSHRVPFHA
jgi:hypothetical protein